MIAGLFAALYFAIAPAVVNGDGLGYLRAAIHGGVYPGHLGYLPLLRLIPAARPIDLLLPARALSVVSGVLSLLLFAATTRRLRLSGWLPATIGLGCSFSVMVSASDVESYAPALMFLCLATWAMVSARPLIGAIAVAAATLIHIENALFVIPLWLAFPRRPWALLPIAALAVASAAARIDPLKAGHGFHYPLRPWTPVVGLYGVAKSLIFSPYPYEASWPRVLVCFGLGASALSVLLWLARAGGTPLGRTITLGWLLPYAIVGLAFFPSDHERWLFLLPLLWLSAAASGRVRALSLLAAAILVANLALWLPRARDSTWRLRAKVASALLLPGDLVISPGHGWDEYVGFWEGPEIRAFPLVYFAGELGGREPLRARLAQEIARATRVLLVRMDDDDPLGWKELRIFGITRDTTLFSGERIRLTGDVSYLRAPAGETRSRN
jgi:hypothetical protein